jgi:hypothetical protein
MNGHALTPSRSHAKPSRGARIVSLFRGHDDLPEAPDADLQDDGSRMGPRRFGLFPVRRRGSAITDAIEAGREDPGMTQALASLRETLQDAAPEPVLAASFTGAALEPLPAPLQRPVMTESELATLAKVADRLRALPAAEPQPQQDEDGQDDEDGPPPLAFLRNITHGPGRDPYEPLAGLPRFAGTTRMADGSPVAGLFLGEQDADGRLVLDALSVTWLGCLIGAAEEARDALYGLMARRGDETADGEAVA